MAMDVDTPRPNRGTGFPHREAGDDQLGLEPKWVREHKKKHKKHRKIKNYATILNIIKTHKNNKKHWTG